MTKKNVIQLLNEIEKLKFEYWELQLKEQELYRIKIIAVKKYAGHKSKTAKIKNEIINKLILYKE